MHLLRRLAALLVASVLLLAVYLAFLRPWLTDWGATPSEIQRELPGDRLWPHPARAETRAVTIHAPASSVWPWVAQLGRGRGGFYSYEFLENLVGADIHNANRVLLGVREFTAGDTLWMAPRDRFGGSGYAWIRIVEPGRAIVVETHVAGDPTPVGTWAFVLGTRGPNLTRFIVRGRSGRAGASALEPASLAERLVFVPMHFVMERKMMLGLRDRAEGRWLWVAGDVAEVVTWMIALAVLLVAALATLLRRTWGWAFALFVAAGLALLLLPLLHPPLAVSLVAALGLLAGLPRAAWARSG